MLPGAARNASGGMTEMKRIYMDHAATAPADPEVVQAMLPFFSEKFGNASSIHSHGQEAKAAVEESRMKVARLIGSETNEVIFTSGGTESDNIALRGVVSAAGKGSHIITSRIEHHAVLNTVKQLEMQGIEVTYLPVDRQGLVAPSDVEAAIKKNTVIVSIMHANNEIGTIEPVADIGRICHDRGVLFHTDAVQSFGRVPIDVDRMNIDMLSASAHKIYGPKGVGCLYVRNGVRLEPQSTGGGHESGRRSGTENVPGIVGFGKASEMAGRNMDSRTERETALRDRLIMKLSDIEDSRLNGHRSARLPNNVNMGFRGIEGESLVIHLDMAGISASTGSACSSKSLTPSHVLTSIGLSKMDAHGSLRLSLGKENTMEEVKYVTEKVPEVVEKLRKISPFGGKAS